MLRSILPGLLFRIVLVGQWLLYVLHDVVRAIYRSSSTFDTDVKPSHGLRAKMLGWPPPKLDPARETAWLDGLRGVAAFLVMAYHFHLEMFGMYLEAPWGAYSAYVTATAFWRLPFLRIWMCSGHAQVSLFFVLSGFVLSWGPLASIRAGRHEKLVQSLSSATFRRWLRLFLPCFIVGIWSIFEFRWGFLDLQVERKDTFFAQFWDYILACGRFANPLHLERNGWESIHVYNWTMWTIPHEWSGSLLVFLVLLAIARIRHYVRRTAVIFCVVLCAYLLAQWKYWLFAFGVLLADYVRQFGGFEQLSRSTNRLSRLAWYLLFIVGLYLAGVPENNPHFTRPGYDFLKRWTPANFMEHEDGARFWWSWAGILVITSVSHLVVLRKFFEMRFMRYLGRISFMLYLTHRSVHGCVGMPLRRKLYDYLGWKEWNEEAQRDVLKSTVPMAFVIYFILWLVEAPIAIFVAHWCEVMVDGPCTRFARWVDDKFVKGFTPDTEQQEEEQELIRLPT